jgi:hypothetical protein
METKLKQKIICKNVTRNIRTGKSKPFKKVTRVCRKKYKFMQPLKHRLYWRDDDKYCYENMHGTDVNTSSKGQCGWYLNDRKKVSDTFSDFMYPLEYVWRQH